MKIIIATLALCSILSFGLTTPQSAHAVQQSEDPPATQIPMLSTLSQISANQLQVTYDSPVDPAKGMDPKNYWIQSTAKVKPKNIATLGMNDSVNKNNTLDSEKVSIKAADNNGQSFVLTFKKKIAKGMPFKMIICYVTKPGAPPYSGDNGSASFIGQ